MPEMFNDSFVAFDKVNIFKNNFKQYVDITGFIITKLS